jgi:prevent-host-death family protein
MVTNIYEAKTHLSRLIKRTLDGEEVIIAKAGKPLVRLVPADSEKKPVKFGLLKGQIHIAEDFDEFGPELQRIFEMEP